MWPEIAIECYADVRKWPRVLEFKIFHQARSWKKWATKVKIANHQYHLLLSLTFFGCYGLSDMFTKTWSGGLSCVFVVFSLPAIVVGFKSFSFPGCSLIRIVSSTTPASVSLVHGFTHDKSVPHLFSTPQTRTPQQNEIFIHLLKKLAPVNEIRGVLSLVDPMWIFSPRISSSGRGAKAWYRTILPKISARRSLLEPSFRCLSPGREGEKCRPLDLSSTQLD